MPETEQREPLDLDAVRARAERYRVLADSSGSRIGPAEVAAAIACAEDLLPILDDLRRVSREHAVLADRYEDRRDELERERGAAAVVARVRSLHQRYRTAWTDDVCSHCTRGMDLVRWPCATVRALDGEPADRAVVGGGVGNPAVEGQPPPTTCGRPGCHGAGSGYEVRGHTVRCERCEETGAGHG